MKFKLFPILNIAFLLFVGFTVCGFATEYDFVRYQETTDGLLVTVDFPNVSINEISEGNEEYVLVELPAVFYTKQPGYPRLPFISLSLKASQNLQFNIVGSESVANKGYKVYPSPKLQIVNGRVEERFYLDKKAYQVDRYYPASCVAKGLNGKFREESVLQLRVFPVQYNPSTGKLRHYSKIELLLKNVDSSDLMSQHIPSRLHSEDSESMLAPAKPGSVFFPTELRRDYKVDYLIITTSKFMFNESMRNFAEWRSTYNGFNVVIVSIQEIYEQFTESASLSDSIKRFIQFAYNYWTSTKMKDNHLGYVLLVGDTELIPPCNSDVILLGEVVPSDNGYASVSGNDLIPDISIGRFPVEDSSELDAVIEKTVQYEKEPVKGEWNNRALLLSGSVESLQKEMESSSEKFLIPSGYDVRTMSLLRGDDWSDVVRQINKGNLIVEYAGHGWIDGWEILKTEEISALDNKGMYPVVSSLSCNTAHYDGKEDSFAEIFVKAKDKGAVAFLGASRKAWISDIGFCLSKAISQRHLYVLGDILLYSKINLIATSELDLQLFNLMGDPALDIYAPRREKGKCDIAVSSEDIQTFPDKLRQGETAKLYLTVKNIGNSNTYKSEVEIYLDRRLLDKRTIPNIPPQDNYRVELDWNVPVGVGKVEFSVNVKGKIDKLEVFEGNNSANRTFDISLEKEGYPISIEADSLLSPCIDDLNGDESDEIIIGYISSRKIHIESRSQNGELIWEYVTDMGRTGITGGNLKTGPFPATGDINGDGRKEIIFGPFNGYLHALNYEGKEITGFPISVGRNGGCTPTLVDVDQDGLLDIVLALSNGKVHAFRYDRIKGKPVELEGWGFSVRKPGTYSGIAAGDVDGDNSPEVFAGYTDNISKSSIFAWSSDGSIVDGFPVKLNDYINPIPTVGDLDADGKGEIVIISNKNRVYLLGINGEIKNSWEIKEVHKFDYLMHPILADFDHDGDLEIVASTKLGNTYAWHHDGRLVYGYPQHSGDRADTPPLFIDVDGDSKEEIVSANYGITLKAYQDNGELVSGWPVNLTGSYPEHMAAGDVDGDGKIELLVKSSSDEIHLLDTLGILNYRLDWRCLGFSPERTSYYGICSSPLFPPVSIVAEDVTGDKGEEILVRWQLPENNSNVSGYNIYRASDREGKYIFIGGTSKNTTSFADKDVRNNREYWYIVRSTDGKYLSSPTLPVSAVAINNFAPPSPNDLEFVDIVDDKLLINWSPAKGASGYKIYYGIHPKNYSYVIDIGHFSSYKLEPIVSKLKHYIVVTSYNANGNESFFSEELTVVAKDDDHFPPEFSNFHPLKVRARKPFYIQCKLIDPSGIWDEGVYLVWDSDGELIESSNRVKMERTSDETFRTTSQIPPQESDANFLYEVFASDNDFDNGIDEDRTFGVSFTQHIEIAEGAQDIYVYPNPINGSRANLHMKLHDSAEVKMNVYDISGRLVKEMTFTVKEGKQSCNPQFDRISSGIYVYRLEINYSHLKNKEIFRGKFAIVK